MYDMVAGEINIPGARASSPHVGKAGLAPAVLKLRVQYKIR